MGPIRRRAGLFFVRGDDRRQRDGQLRRRARRQQRRPLWPTSTRPRRDNHAGLWPRDARLPRVDALRRLPVPRTAPRRRSDGWLAAAALIAAAADLGVKLGSGASLIAANSTAELTPDLARHADRSEQRRLHRHWADHGGVRPRPCRERVRQPGAAAHPRLDRSCHRLARLVTPILGFTDPDNYNPLPYLGAAVDRGGRRIARMVTDGAAVAQRRDGTTDAGRHTR